MALRVAMLTLSGCHFPLRRCAVGARLIRACGRGQLRPKPHDEMDESRAASRISHSVAEWAESKSIARFAVTGYRLRERLAAPVAEIRNVQILSSGARR